MSGVSDLGMRRAARRFGAALAFSERLWFYYQAASYIDAGFEAIHFGQVEIMNRNDRDNAHWEDLLTRVRAYAAKHARRHMVLVIVAADRAVGPVQMARLQVGHKPFGHRAGKVERVRVAAVSPIRGHRTDDVRVVGGIAAGILTGLETLTAIGIKARPVSHTAALRKPSKSRLASFLWLSSPVRR